MALKIATVAVQGKVANQVRLGLPTDGSWSDGQVELNENDSTVDAIDQLNEGVKSAVQGISTSLLSTDPGVSFEGDPNDPAAPSVLQNAATNTWYYGVDERRYYRKEPDRWVPLEERVFRGTTEIYINPTTGNDLDVGDATRPIQSLAEWMRRVPLIANGVQTFLSAGQHKLRDIRGLGVDVVDAAAQLKPQFYGAHETLTLTGTVSTYTTLNVTGTVDNVMNVSDTLVADELRGKYIEAGSAKRWITGNTTNTVTVAANVVSLGGTITLPTGSVDVFQLDSEVLPPDTNAGNLRNRFFFTGAMNVAFVHFDGLGAGFNGVEGINIGRSKAEFDVCKFSNWNGSGIYAPTVSVKNNYFDEIGTLALWIGAFASLSGDNVFRNCRYCMGANAPGGQGDTGNITLTSNFMAWINSCRALFGTTIYDLVDNGYGYWLDDTAGGWSLEGLFSIETPMAHYQKILRPLRKIGGTADWPAIFYCRLGNIIADLQDATNASVGTSLLFNDGTNSITPAAFNAGTPPASSVRHLSTPRGCRIFDTDDLPEPV